MRIVLDAQLPPGIQETVAKLGSCACVHVDELGLRTATDDQIFGALGSAGDVILTKDGDFVDLVTRRGPPPKILWVRVGNASRTGLAHFLESTLQRAIAELDAGASVVELRRR